MISSTPRVNLVLSQEIGFLKKHLTLRKFACVVRLRGRPVQRNDDYRQADVARDGGFNLDDAALLAKYRSAFKDLLG